MQSTSSDIPHTGIHMANVKDDHQLNLLVDIWIWHRHSNLHPDQTMWNNYKVIATWSTEKNHFTLEYNGYHIDRESYGRTSSVTHRRMQQVTQQMYHMQKTLVDRPSRSPYHDELGKMTQKAYWWLFAVGDLQQPTGFIQPPRVSDIKIRD